MRHVLIACVVLGIGTAVQGDDGLAAAISKIDGTVATPDERDALAHQVREQLRVRLQTANEKSSEEWRAVQTRDEWEALKSQKLAALRASLGVGPDSAKLRVEVTGSFVARHFRVQNLLIEARPNWWITANLYGPAKLSDSMPGIVICHSHHTPKHHGELQEMGMMWAWAGCYVLVPDQVGHGERRQHPFQSAADYSRPFGVGRQDYYFRYDNAIQLHMVGESLIGWMVYDIMRCVDVLQAQPGIDPKRILLLGSVAGGGDPAAVAGALDERFAAVVPFNFGGPQPETRFPLPDDIEMSFNYAGSGGWESTRNLQQSARGGFLPWMIVGGIAPRRLIYAHEFGWDRQRDPVWKRLQSIYGLYEQPDNLAFTHGRGELKGQPPEASHCTHIGAPHRVKIHEAFAKWFGIEVTEEPEFHREPAESLLCWTPGIRQEFAAKTLSEKVLEVADLHRQHLLRTRQSTIPEQRRQDLQTRWETLLGNVTPERFTMERRREADAVTTPTVEYWMLTAESGIRLPCVLLQPKITDRNQPLVLAICSQGKSRLMNERSTEIAGLLQRGAIVCLFDPRGIGESKLGDSHTRRSSATSHASTDLMLGTPLLGEQLRDVRLVLNWLRRRQDSGFRPLVVWGESLVPPNLETAEFKVPRDDDQALPAVSEPQAPLLALLAGLFEDDLEAIYTCGGLVSWRSLLTSYLVLTAHDVVVPGALTAGELSDIVAAHAPGARIRQEIVVDGWNRLASDADVTELRTAAGPNADVQQSRGGIVTWLFEK
ncbi:MAG: acetylxylan esterase [Planctomycetes bacterium]|nr:acetylxylan esterase [Planctomycetota bacterium]